MLALADAKQLRTAIETSTSTFDKEKAQERLARLSGGVAVFKVFNQLSSPEMIIFLFFFLLIFELILLWHNSTRLVEQVKQKLVKGKTESLML